MQRRLMCGLSLFLLVAAPAMSQKAAGEEAAQEVDPAELLRQMGAGEQDIAKFQLMTKLLGPDADPLLLLMMMEGGNQGNGDLMGMLLFSKMLGSAGKAAPVVTAIGTRLFIVEDGTVYVLDTATLKIEGSVSYRPPKARAGLPADLLPMLQQAREKAQAAACLSNMKQLGLAAMMYAQDWDETLPSEEWPQQLQPYLKNTQVLKCPSAPEREVAFALNQAVAGAKLADVKRPGEVVLFFETGGPEDIPFGGPDFVPTEPRHGGQVTVGFVDGHAQLVPPDKLRGLLQEDPFR
jgi:prepilin-type processing-associated H-X9-DG protein